LALSITATAAALWLARSRVIVEISNSIRDLNLRTSQNERIIETLRRQLYAVNQLEEK
jgi:hypothetical protein